MLEMDGGRKECGCKGIRSCLTCEKTKGIRPKFANFNALKKRSLVFCHRCNTCYPGWDWVEEKEEEELDRCPAHPKDLNSLLPPNGVYLQPEFISEEEERHLVERINGIPWAESQSGRRKQDFGPKVNFKKKKVRAESFLGFPPFARFLLTRFSDDVPRLRDFRPVELCHLQYDPRRGATIDPHKDDAWLWGERLVTVNLGSSTVLTLTAEEDLEGAATTTTFAVRVPLPRRSLLVLDGEARHDWMHAILREDVRGERIAATFRELSAEFRAGGTGEDIGQELLRRAALTMDIA